MVCTAAAALGPGADPRYFGLSAPQGRPERFTPAAFDSLGVMAATNPAFSPDYSRFVFTTVNTETPGHVVLAVYQSRFDGARWSRPAYVRELNRDGFNSAEAAFSPDGKWLYLSSNRPPGTPPWNVKIFRAPVTEDGFGPVEPVELAVPASAGTFYPQVRPDGALMFTSSGLPGQGRGDLYVAAARAGGGFELPVSAGGDFNSREDDWDLVEHPGGRLRLWASGREGGAGRVDIYFSRRRPGGDWSPAANLAAVNTAAVETAPRLSPDGRVLFFQRVAGGREQIFWVDLASIVPAG